MKQTITAMAMGMGPWGQMVWINIWLGVLGLAMQVAGIIWMICLGRSGKFLKV